MARASVEAANSPILAMSMARFSCEAIWPDDITNKASPSNGAKTGRMAREKPDSAICATRFASLAVRITSVAMQAMVVFWPSAGLDFAAPQYYESAT